MIRKAIRAFADYANLSDYKRRQITKGELEHPQGWGVAPEEDNSADACVYRFYRAIYAMYGEDKSSWPYSGILCNFQLRMETYYGVSRYALYGRYALNG